MGAAPIFIVGCSRSGTSMLRDLLRSHPNLALPPESHFIPRLYRGWGDPRSERQAVALGRRILGLNTVRKWRLGLEPDDFAGCRTFRQALDVLYGEVARREGKPRWGDKTPHYVAHIPVLLRIFPEAKVLHIYRDGRDVALSWVGHRFGPTNVFGAATAWRHLVSSGRREGASRTESYMEIRYEGFLESPEETMRSVCEFVGEPFVEAVLTPAARGRVYAPRKVTAGTLRERTQVERGNKGKWRTQMRREDREMVESVAGDLLTELGYAVEGLARPIPRLRRWWLGTRNQVGMALSKQRFRELSLRNSILIAHADVRARLRDRD